MTKNNNLFKIFVIFDIYYCITEVMVCKCCHTNKKCIYHLHAWLNLVFILFYPLDLDQVQSYTDPPNGFWFNCMYNYCSLFVAELIESLICLLVSKPCDPIYYFFFGVHLATNSLSLVANHWFFQIRSLNSAKILAVTSKIVATWRFVFSLRFLIYRAPDITGWCDFAHLTTIS